jgi:hypothetical protein
LRPLSRAARFAKLGWNAPDLSRSGGWNYPHRTRPSRWITMRMTTALAAGPCCFGIVFGNKRQPVLCATKPVGCLARLDEKQVLLGCGSSEILRMAATRLVADSPTRKCLIQALPTCPPLGKFARSIGGNVIDVPLEKKK